MRILELHILLQMTYFRLLIASLGTAGKSVEFCLYMDTTIAQCKQ